MRQALLTERQSDGVAEGHGVDPDALEPPLVMVPFDNDQLPALGDQSIGLLHERLDLRDRMHRSVRLLNEPREHPQVQEVSEDHSPIRTNLRVPRTESSPGRDMVKIEVKIRDDCSDFACGHSTSLCRDRRAKSVQIRRGG